MQDQIKQFIEKHIQLIDTNEFEALYQIGIKEGITIYHLTEVLLQVNIDPLLYMEKVPHEYYPIQNVNEHIILPAHIKSIGRYAYGSTEIKSIILPEGLLTIEDYAFYDTCIEDILLPNSLKTLGPGCFKASKLKRIQYNGTVNEFYKVEIWDEPFFGVPGTTINCKDGDIQIKDF